MGIETEMGGDEEIERPKQAEFGLLYTIDIILKSLLSHCQCVWSE